MHKAIISALTAGTLSLGLAACGSNNNGPTASNITGPGSPGGANAVQYAQIERLSRPAVKEVFERFVDHQASNATEPYNDLTIKTSITQTEDTLRPPVAGGSDYGATLASVLYPDEYLVNLNGAAPSGADPYYFLSTEVSGGAAFGGRAPNDDVIGLELPILFGGILPALGLAKEDNQENNCLSAQNLTLNPTQASIATFPYLNTPH